MELSISHSWHFLLHNLDKKVEGWEGEEEATYSDP